MSPSYHLHPLGDSAITINFANVIDPVINRWVIALFNHMSQRTSIEKKLIGIKDIIPAYSNLTIEYDVTVIRNLSAVTSAFKFIQQYIEDSMQRVDWNKIPESRLIEIPVCYDNSLAPDLHALASEKKLSSQEVIQLHSEKTYHVYMIGFLPGFAYMGKVDERIATPRKTNPEIKVIAGSVGIAGEQTGIYPMDSPGGWNIIGETPLKMFDAERDEPALLKAGDQVKFVPVTMKHFLEIKSTQ